MTQAPVDLGALERAAARGETQALYNLGVYKLTGPATHRDAQKARECFEDAARRAFAPAMSALGYLYLRAQGGVAFDCIGAQSWFRQAAELGFAEAQYRLGELLMVGAAGSPEPDAANDWLERAAQQGHPDAQCQYAYCIEHDMIHGVPTDAAGPWWLRAAAQDCPRALFVLGRRLTTGENLPHDTILGHACLLRAMSLGYWPAGAVLEDHKARLSSTDLERSHALSETRISESWGELAPAPRETTACVTDKVSWEPRVFVLRGLLSAEECAHLMLTAKPYLQPSKVFQKSSEERRVVPQRRSGSVSLVDPLRDVVIWNIEQRLAGHALLPVSHGEPLTILRYAVGDEYRPHFDFFDPGAATTQEILRRNGQRQATLMVYLSEVAEGGATEFPDAGIKIDPEAGMGLLFFNTKPDGSPDPLTLHAGLPVGRGEKWVATRWIRDREQ